MTNPTPSPDLAALREAEKAAWEHASFGDAPHVKMVYREWGAAVEARVRAEERDRAWAEFQEGHDMHCPWAERPSLAEHENLILDDARATITRLQAEVAHWKANHDSQVAIKRRQHAERNRLEAEVAALREVLATILRGEHGYADCRDETGRALCQAAMHRAFSVARAALAPAPAAPSEPV